MKKILDWQEKRIVNIFDEVNLWTAPFGRLLLDNIPMKKGMTIVDIGFGTGFPLIELSQRFGEDSKIYGIDIWKAAIERTKQKIETLELKNIEIIEESASKIKIADQTIDLITSNLGVNNFEDRIQVYSEIYRILKPGGRLSITTNPIGTFKELFNLFEDTIKEMSLEEELIRLKDYIANRNTEDQIIDEFKQSNLRFVKRQSDLACIRLMDSKSLLNHSLVRIGFREGWDKIIREEKRDLFYSNLCIKLDNEVKEKGEFKMTIPLLYLEFEK